MNDFAPASPAPPAASGGTLTTVARLAERLHGAGIRYCHWKSNEHLDASVAGLTDLDVLVEEPARLFGANGCDCRRSDWPRLTADRHTHRGDEQPDNAEK